MALKQQLLTDLKEAMKAGNQWRTDILRLLNSALHNKEIEKRSKAGVSELTDEEIISVLVSEAKKRREAADLFTKGNRPDLAEKEQKELDFIQQYLPKQMSSEEIEKEVMVVFRRLPDLSDFGSAMKEAMKTLRGKADAKIISEVIKRQLEKQK